MSVNNLRIILVEPTHPGNIGAVARAMKNMGLQRLILARPLAFPHAEATARAAGADDVLTAARVVDGLETALRGCRMAFGLSARRRGVASPTLDPRQGAARAVAAAAQGETALVFGRESAGLTNDELDRCHYLVRIPTAPEFGSLNLAAAVAIMAYEVRLAVLAGAAVPAASPRLPAPAEEMELFYEHLERVLLATGFLNPANPRPIMRRLRRLFNRAQPEQREVDILRGVLTSAQRPKRR